MHTNTEIKMRVTAGANSREIKILPTITLWHLECDHSESSKSYLWMIKRMGMKFISINSIGLGGNIWAATRENLASGFLTKRASNQPAQLQRLARKLKLRS